MLSLNNAFFIDQFNNTNERQNIIFDLLTPGVGAVDHNTRGGILQNFNLQNVSAKLALDKDL